MMKPAVDCPPEEPVCNCTEACIEDAVSEACPVCAGDFSGCAIERPSVAEPKTAEIADEGLDGKIARIAAGFGETGNVDVTIDGDTARVSVKQDIAKISFALAAGGRSDG